MMSDGDRDTVHRRMTALSVGLPRSGTTWVFNVILEMLREAYPQDVTGGVFADQLNEDVEEKGRSSSILVIKSHIPGPSLRHLSEWHLVRAVITLRSPYDCIASLVEKFQFSFNEALEAVRASCSSIRKMMPNSQCVTFRYEDGFILSRGTLEAIGDLLGINLPVETYDRILAAYAADAVRVRLDTMVREGLFKGDSSLHEIDDATQWHYDHLGDGRSGKAESLLSNAQIAFAGYVLRDLVPHLGYKILDVHPLVTAGTKIEFGCEGVGAACLATGFGAVESWGVWAVSERANFDLHISENAGAATSLVLRCRLGPSFRAESSSALCEIWLNGRHRKSLRARGQDNEYIIISLSLRDIELSATAKLAIELKSYDIMSPKELGLFPDDRRLSIGLIGCELSREDTASLVD